MKSSNHPHEKVLADWRIQAGVEVAYPGERVSRVDFDSTGWYTASVPSTVLATLIEHREYEDPYFGKNLAKVPRAPFQGPWWYRTQFSLSEATASETVLLEFEGINYAGAIWINGQSVAPAGETRGAFRRWQFDASSLVAAGENCLAVEVFGPKGGDFSTGFVDWNPPPPDGNMGLFRPVRLRFCDAVSIEHPCVRTHVNLPTLDQATLTVEADLVNHSGAPVSGLLEGRIETTRLAKHVHLEPREHATVVFDADEYPELRIEDPRIWWPHDLGQPQLYEGELRFVVDSHVSDAKAVRFGVRDVADYWTGEGHRGFKINGRKVLIKGAGWTDDLLLTDTPERIDAQLRYVKHVNLNCIRCEGIWGKDQALYDLCDEHGILAMVGWSCHWEHEQYLGKPVNERFGGVVSAEDVDLVARSWKDQLLWLRNHPSIFVWAVASDKVPAPDLERRYVETFEQRDPTRPYLASTGGVGSKQKIIGEKEITSDVSGPSGVKMLGPYAYTPPVYWYTDTHRGGAYGFNTETCPGAVVPTLESLKRMLGDDHLWPVDDVWDFHCGLNEFSSLDRYREAIRRRYGSPDDVGEFHTKAQLLNYELARPMFEAFRVNQGRATGVVQWMLNAAWPKMYWQLYDWYLMPTVAFYATRNACQSPQLVYHYGEHSIYVVNDSRENTDPLTACIRVYDIESKLELDERRAVGAHQGRAEKILELPALRDISTTYFLHLLLSNKAGESVAENFYWLSTKPDVLDYTSRVEPWEYHTPSSQYADLTQLDSLFAAEIDVRHRIDVSRQVGAVTVELANRSNGIAFFIELLLTDPDTGEPVVPVFWQDNFVSLLPRETKTLTAALRCERTPVLTVRGANVERRQYGLNPH